ncbi:MAG: TonB-dependent receptor, partial [Bacteroidales bacterium]|nr:TonB-dependent receptor [Bacteroidales bacterium]
MRKALHILTFVFFLFPVIQAQESNQSLITIKLNDVRFDEFAKLMKSDYQIQIYYRSEWLENIKVSTTGEAKSIENLLDEIFKPYGIQYFHQGNNQIFVTGPDAVIDLSRLKSLTNIQVLADSADNSSDKELFRAHSYERKVRKVVIGGDNPAQGRRKVFINGRISNITNGESVIGATVVVSGTSIGAITDANGAFTLPLQSGQSYNVQISCLGMENETYLMDVNGPGILNIEMQSKLIDVKEVVVKSGINHNVRGMQMGFQRIGTKEIKSIPAVMGERDIFKVATLMPGVQTVGEGSAGFNVRGSASDQNLFLLNEIPILNTGHLFGFFSAFNPDMISDFKLYKSNFPVEFGGRLASVFEISTRKGNKKEFGARGSISPVTASILLETPIVKDKSSFIFSTRSSYSDWILNRLEDSDLYNREASFYDIMTGIHMVSDNNASTQIFGYYSKDRFSLSTSNLYGYENIGASVIYNRPLKGKWTINAAGIFSSYTNRQANMDRATRAFEHQFNVRSQEVKFTVSAYPLVRHKVGFGGNAILHNLDQGILQPYGEESIIAPIDFGKENGLEYALHIFDEITITDKLSFYGGLRYSMFNHLESKQHYSGPEIRAAFNLTISKDLSVKTSYNRMRQYLFMLSNSVSISPTDRWKLTNSYITPPVSDQISLGLYKNFNNSSLETSVELYYKKGQNIIEYKDGADLTF